MMIPTKPIDSLEYSIAGKHVRQPKKKTSSENTADIRENAIDEGVIQRLFESLLCRDYPLAKEVRKSFVEEVLVHHLGIKHDEEIKQKLINGKDDVLFLREHIISTGRLDFFVRLSSDEAVALELKWNDKRHESINSQIQRYLDDPTVQWAFLITKDDYQWPIEGDDKRYTLIHYSDLSNWLNLTRGKLMDSVAKGALENAHALSHCMALWSILNRPELPNVADRVLSHLSLIKGFQNS